MTFHNLKQWAGILTTLLNRVASDKEVFASSKSRILSRGRSKDGCSDVYCTGADIINNNWLSSLLFSIVVAV